jgi:hypothetical protein
MLCQKGDEITRFDGTVFFIKHEGALVFYLTIGKAGRHAAVEY